MAWMWNPRCCPRLRHPFSSLEHLQFFFFFIHSSLDQTGAYQVFFFFFFFWIGVYVHLVYLQCNGCSSYFILFTDSCRSRFPSSCSYFIRFIHPFSLPFHSNLHTLPMRRECWRERWKPKGEINARNIHPKGSHNRWREWSGGKQTNNPKSSQLIASFHFNLNFRFHCQIPARAYGRHQSQSRTLLFSLDSYTFHATIDRCPTRWCKCSGVE